MEDNDWLTLMRPPVAANRGKASSEGFVRAVEKQFQPEAHFDEVIAYETAISRSLDGRFVFSDTPRQLALF
ncbi:MAG: hypothetical protein ACREQ2_27385 [Candidatus Binatia bacterium]